MLFHPRNPRTLLGYRWHGVIPSRRDRLAESLSQALKEHLITPEDTRTLLEAIPFERHLDRIVTQTLEKEIPRELLSKLPGMGNVREKLIDLLRRQILARLPKSLSELDEDILAQILNEFDIAEHIRNRLLELPLEDLDALIHRVARRELKSIELAGAGIGLAIGLIQALIVSLL